MVVIEMVGDDDSRNFPVVAVNDVRFRFGFWNAVANFWLSGQTPLNSVVDVDQAGNFLNFRVDLAGSDMALDNRALESHVVLATR